jgi:hypothetical protein
VFGDRAIALQPSEKFLFSREHIARFVSQSPYYLVT